MPVPPRGLRDIPTLGGRGNQVEMPYKTYMQLSVLEMERARRMKERESAEARIARIDARMREIDLLEEALLNSVGKQSIEESDTSRSRPSPTEGFVIRY
jgi:hypothetical protein